MTESVPVTEFIVRCEEQEFLGERHYHMCEPIVRCRDCRHYREHEWIIATDVSDVCHFWHGEPTKVEPYGFCAWGERRDA